MLRLATEDDLAAIKKIANQNRNHIGFVMNVALRESIKANSLWVLDAEEGVVGFVHYHARRDGWQTLHELALSRNRQGQGLGRLLLERVPLPIRLKTTQDNPGAARFYEREGFIRVRLEEGRKRGLVVYEKLAPALEPGATAGRRARRP